MPVFNRLAPSDPDQSNNLYTFLSNPDYRKAYNNILKSSEKYSKVLASTWFLNKCLEDKVIPKTFRIKNRPTSNYFKSWTTMAFFHCV